MSRSLKSRAEAPNNKQTAAAARDDRLAEFGNGSAMTVQLLSSIFAKRGLGNGDRISAVGAAAKSLPIVAKSNVPYDLKQVAPASNQSQQASFASKNALFNFGPQAAGGIVASLCGRNTFIDECGDVYDICCKFLGGPNPLLDFARPIKKSIHTILSVPYGFVTTAANIVLPADLPFVAIQTNPDRIQIQPNTTEGFTMADLDTALGFTNNTGTVLSSLVVLNLPGAALATLNSIYLIVSVPTATDQFYGLRKLDWTSGCLAPRLNSYIQIQYGATAGVFQITAFDKCTQTLTLTATTLYGFVVADIVRMTVPPSSYCYYIEDCKPILGDGSCC